MCCCKSYDCHDQALKFVLFAEEESKLKPIFEKSSFRSGYVTQLNLDKEKESCKL